MFSEMRSN